MNPYDVPVLRQIGRSVLVPRADRGVVAWVKATIVAVKQWDNGHFSFLVRDEYTGEQFWVYDMHIRAD